VSVEKEACPNNLAPTSSTTAQLVMGDAIAVSLLACKDFTEEDFARFHPGGILGKRLNIKVQDLISDYTPKVNPNASINEVIIEISQNRLGVTAVLNDKKLAGIITDGDIRRMLEDEKDISSLCAKDIMSRDPKITKPDDLAYNALKEMEQNNITQLIVIKSEKYLGVIHIHDIIKEGIISQ
ncbi:MAG TPA: CBS domain-containing protein, partial [Candidatus Marinimicrobia bacterium]|nr:CBS domain-containing protein [Candidatus Neomarinimicrobiota bacterium]